MRRGHHRVDPLLVQPAAQRQACRQVHGPVIDPRESWGFGVLQVPSEAAAAALIEAAPAKALGRHELLPIPRLVR